MHIKHVTKAAILQAAEASHVVVRELDALNKEGSRFKVRLGLLPMRQWQALAAYTNRKTTWDLIVPVLSKYLQGLPLCALKAGLDQAGWGFTGKDPHQALTQVLSEAIKDGRATRVGRGAYALTAKGKAAGDSPAVVAKVAKAARMMKAGGR